MGGGAVGGLDERAEHVTGSTYSKMRKTYDMREGQSISRPIYYVGRERRRREQQRAVNANCRR